jgi:hypothetical protein
MFNLIMRNFDWALDNGTMHVSRFLEYTDDHIAEQFRQQSNLLLDRLATLPCLFMTEGIRDEIGYVGWVSRARLAGKEVLFEYSLDATVPPLQNSMLYDNRAALDMRYDFEFSRNHWAVKDVDLFRFLYRTVVPRRQRKSVFQLPEHEKIEMSLASAMMPFDAGYSAVYESIREATENAGLSASARMTFGKMPWSFKMWLR